MTVPIQRVAVVFDDRARPETTGIYCLRALRSLVGTEHVRPTDLGRVSAQDFDIFVVVDDGLDYPLPANLRPRAWWAIDTHLDFARDCVKAAGFDLVFAAQRDGAEGLRRAGATDAMWLPLACDPEVHAKFDVAKEFDLCFVGNVFPGVRATLLALLQRYYPKAFVGRRYFEEMARVYSATRVVFNRSIENDVNMRVFEAVACGSLLLTNDLTHNGQAELFRDGVHLATYRDAEDLLDKVRFCLERSESRERIAATGRAEALAGHTYRHRMEHLLLEAGRCLATVALPCSIRSEVLPRPDGGPAPGPPADAGTPLGPDRSYYEFARPEILARIPMAARKVLDIGCGTGRLGGAIKARQSAEVVGVELDPMAAEAARARLDRVLGIDIERPWTDFVPGEFDAAVCGDVLEHLVDPEALLRKLGLWLKSEGRLVASIPNVRHHSVVRGLLEGNWTYEGAGLLDQTHLRFFTRRSIEDLFDRCGFVIEAVEIVLGPSDEGPARNSQGGSVRVGQLRLDGLSPAEAEEFFTYQYLVTARPAPTSSRGIATAGGRSAALGCVLAVRDRSPVSLERTLQTYAYQTIRPTDKVLLDYGSTATLAETYRELCLRYGWRHVACESPATEWWLSDAYNRAVAALDPAVEVVFKNDADVLLGEDVLAIALERGRDRLCLFSRLTTTEGATYPARFGTHEDVAGLLGAKSPPAPADSEGIQAFPAGGSRRSAASTWPIGAGVSRTPTYGCGRSGRSGSHGSPRRC
jgi:O-antigen biosynthesis protein